MWKGLNKTGSQGMQDLRQKRNTRERTKADKKFANVGRSRPFHAWRSPYYITINVTLGTLK